MTAPSDENEALRERLAVAFRSCTRSPHHLAFLVEPIVLDLMAQAWDEGYGCGLDDYGKDSGETVAMNPYRVIPPAPSQQYVNRVGQGGGGDAPGPYDD